MPCRTVAARRTEDQPRTQGWGLRALADTGLGRRSAVPVAPRASARRRQCAPGLGAYGRWRCRWSAPPLLVDRVVAGIARRARRSRPSLAGWSCARCWAGRGGRVGVRRRVTIGSRRAPMRSSATRNAAPSTHPLNPTGRHHRRLYATASMEGDSERVATAFHGCRSKTGADRAPADARSSSGAGVCRAAIKTLASRASEQWLRIAPGYAGRPTL
jgi:hypothetical protein